MSNSETGGPAFPFSDKEYGGMTLRDYFAGQFIASVAPTVQTASILYTDKMAQDAYAVADAMIEQKRLRETRPTQPPVDNAHVAKGAQKFSAEDVERNK